MPVLGTVDALDPDERDRRASTKVALVSMPFVSVHRPSIQLGLLKPIATSHGFPTETFHLSLDFGSRIGVELYELLAEHRGRMIGDWLFSVAAFGPDAPDRDGRLLVDFETEVAAQLTEVDVAPERLREIRDHDVPAFLDEAVETISWHRFDVVGFTSTFQQNAASFALARAIKARWPHVTTLFGGANFEGEMGQEWVRSIEAVDFAVSGEADQAFSEFLVALSRGEDPAAVPGVIGRGESPAIGGERGLFDRLDELPVPDYGEYFERIERLELIEGGGAGRRSVSLPFESARGCWWGAKRHCTFCGLNGSSMTYRSKSASRVSAELREMARRYRTFDFQAVDNIVERDYLQQLFPAIARSGDTYRIFYETKADLTERDLAGLRRGGVTRIQPGVESLSSHVLALMRKGTRASTNVNLLRWSLHHDIDVAWNVLWGFPGETEQDYVEQTELVPAVVHLQPPGGSGRIWMERFSPIFTERERFTIEQISPEASYRYVYPESVDLDRAAYFFEYELAGTLPDSSFEAFATALEDWRQRWSADDRPTLRYWCSGDFLQIEDRRDPDAPGTHTFDGPLASLYLACSQRPRAARDARRIAELPYPEDEVSAALDEFCERRLMMRDGNLFLALAVPATATVNGTP